MSSITSGLAFCLIASMPFIWIIRVLMIKIKLLRLPKNIIGNEQKIDSKKEKFIMIKSES